MSDYDADQLTRLDPPYVARYGLTSAPFADTVDESYTYLDAERLQRLNMLQHLTQYSELLLIVTGEKGVGKTTLLNCFVRDVDEEAAVCQVNANPMMDADRLLLTIAENYKLKEVPQDPAALQEKLYHFLAELHHQNKIPVLVIDDAHSLPQDALETLFTLADAEASDGNLLRIILFSDPQIETMLDSPEIQRMRERVTHTMDIPPMSEEQTIEYIRHRMNAAGLQGSLPFNNKELKKVFHNSAGIPARINECAHLILNGGNLDQAIKDFHVPKVSRFSKTQIAGISVTLLLVAMGLIYQDNINKIFDEDAAHTEQTIPELDNIPMDMAEPDAELHSEQNKENVLPELSEPPLQDLVQEDNKEKPTNIKTETGQVIKETHSPAKETGVSEQQTVTAIAADKDSQLKATVEKPAAVPAKKNIVQPVVDKPKLLLSQIQPNPVPASRKPQTITIHGSGFTAKTKIRVYWAGRSKLLPAKQYKYINESKIEIYITVGAQADTWKIRVSDPAIEKPVQASFKVAAIIAREKKPATQTKTNTTQFGSTWLAKQNPDHFTIQLLASHDLTSVQSFTKRNQLNTPYAIVKSKRQGKVWYLLITGSHTSKNLAQSASKQLAESIRGLKPWVRQFAHIQSLQAPSSSLKSPSAQSQAGSPTMAKIAVDTKPPTSQNLAENESWLWTQDPGHYTLQLMNSQQESGVKKYISQYKLKGKAVYYRSLRNGEVRYIIIYGNYVNRDVARNAIKSLPKALQSNQPWARSFASVHSDLNSH